MGLSGAVRWWEEWQLRILALASLSAQCYLSFFASARKKHIRPLYRFFIWLAYLAGDSLAIYALATLFNRQRNVHVNGSRDLEVLWAPILLIHLGGQLNISAYNIEDNELWRRHILTAVSQITVAVYVFCKSWSSSADKRLLAAAILLFVFGVFKCFGKVIALKRASFNTIVSTFLPSPRTENTKTRDVELEEYIQGARDFVRRNKDPPALESDDERLAHREQLCIPDKLFVDYAYVYHDRLTNLKSFWLLDKETTYEALRAGISNTFDLIYSQEPQSDDKNRAAADCANACSILIFLSNLLLPIVPICLFHSSHKEAYKGSDIKVTFVLLYITYFVEISSFIRIIGSYNEWSSEGVAQLSIIGYLARNKRHPWIMTIAELLQCKGLLDTCFGSSKDITMLVRGHVIAGWMTHITDIESYWRFSDTRGHWALERNRSENILWSIDEKPFDESIILWHVATDFCFHGKGSSPNSECAGMCRQISNYMMHLLFANPEMLLPSSRRSLFTTAYEELEAILQGDDLSQLGEKGHTQMIIDKDWRHLQRGSRGCSFGYRERRESGLQRKGFKKLLQVNKLLVAHRLPKARFMR
ncbi:hypothetical protein BS78_07G041700 [Paspalum vaginatum]|nr:hypothetical protein BS78_07G041700 [Paspalum vaginatum]